MFFNYSTETGSSFHKEALFTMSYTNIATKVNLLLCLWKVEQSLFPKLHFSTFSNPILTAGD